MSVPNSEIGGSQEVYQLRFIEKQLERLIGVVSKITGGGGGSGTVTSFSSGNLSPLFTTAIATASTTPALSFTLSNAGAHTWYGNNTGGSTAPSFNSAGSLTEVTSSVLTITGTSTLLSGTTVQVKLANTTTDGYLSSTDWNTFNSKQSTVTFGTGVQTALGVNIGSVGAPILFNGAGGTPSSLTLTNATGLPPTTGIVGWPSNSAGVLTNNGSGTLTWGAAGWAVTGSTSITGNTTQTGAFTNTFSLNGILINQNALSSAWTPSISSTPGAHTALTATTEFIDYDFKNRTVTWLDGTTATQRFAYFRGNTVNKTTTSATFTNIYTAYFDPSIAGTGVTFTNNYVAGFNGMVAILNGSGTLNMIIDGVSSSIRGSISLTFQTSSVTRYIISSSGNHTFTGGTTSGGTNTWVSYTQSAQTSGIPTGFSWTAAAHTNLTTATEITDINFDLSAVLKMASGTVATQRAFRIQGRTYTPQSSTLTLTEVSTLEVNPPIAGASTTFGNGATLGYAIKSTGNVALATVGNKLFIAEGSGGSVGQTTLVSGTKAITIAGLTTASRAFISFVSQGGTSTAVYQYAGVCTTNTLTITAITVTGTTVTTDTSIVNYFIIN